MNKLHGLNDSIFLEMSVNVTARCNKFRFCCKLHANFPMLILRVRTPVLAQPVAASSNFSIAIQS